MNIVKLFITQHRANRCICIFLCLYSCFGTRNYNTYCRMRVHSEVQVALRSDFYLRATEVSLQFVSLLETKFHLANLCVNLHPEKIVLFVNFPVKMPIFNGPRITAPKFFSCKMVIYLFWFSI